MAPNGAIFIGFVRDIPNQRVQTPLIRCIEAQACLYPQGLFAALNGSFGSQAQRVDKLVTSHWVCLRLDRITSHHGDGSAVGLLVASASYHRIWGHL